MQELSSTIEIKSQLDKVFELARNMYSYPEVVPDLKSVTVLERSDDGKRVVTEWAAVVREFRVIIKWTAEDLWDDEAHTCTFSVAKGDRGKYSGVLTFTDLGDRVRLDGDIKAECDVRRFGRRIERFVAGKMKKNVDSILEAIKAKAEESVVATV